jgi:hypothetical protein
MGPLRFGAVGEDVGDGRIVAIASSVLHPTNTTPESRMRPATNISSLPLIFSSMEGYLI